MEHVLTIRRALVAEYLPRRGVSTRNSEKLVDIILSSHEFLPRPEAENDSAYKQVIPYVVLTRGSEVFVTRRLKKGTETRLHGLLSIGIGGHVSREADGDGADVLRRGMERELAEEVLIEETGALTPRGIINDDTQEVGSVHLGLLFTLEVSGEVRVRETEKLEGFWKSRAELSALKAQMETWSQFAAETLFSE